jgi:hypothetical protein
MPVFYGEMRRIVARGLMNGGSFFATSGGKSALALPAGKFSDSEPSLRRFRSVDRARNRREIKEKTSTDAADFADQKE